MPRGNLLKDATLPAPMAGMNVADPAFVLQETEACFLLNTVAGERGLKARPGTQEHASGIGAGAPVEMRSLLAYHGSQGSKDRLFVCAPDGIYGITTVGGAPSLALTFASAAGKAGFGVSSSYAITSGRYDLYCDEVNGYHLYTEAADTWAVGSVTGVSPGDLVFVLAWKNRVWFVERNSSRAWFLGLEAISGAANQFDFGRHFTKGGYLLGLWNWTREGGTGSDDYLVALSSSGNIVVFKGTDPTIDTTFSIVGSWDVGGFPAGRRLACSSGGDLLINTTQGVLPLSKLLSGQPMGPDLFDTRKLRPLFTSLATTQRDLDGWDLIIHPQEACLLVNTPGTPGQEQEQLALSLSSQGWSRWRGLDILCWCVWQGSLYFGTRNSRVMRSTGELDNVADDGDTSAAVAIDCFVLHAFTTGGSAKRKMVRQVKPFFHTDGTQPSFSVFLRYDFDTSLPAGIAPAAFSDIALWDVALWDDGLWAADSGIARRPLGATGIGTAIGVGVFWKSNGLAILAGTTVWWEEGGPL